MLSIVLGKETRKSRENAMLEPRGHIKHQHRHGAGDGAEAMEAAADAAA